MSQAVPWHEEAALRGWSLTPGADGLWRVRRRAGRPVPAAGAATPEEAVAAATADESVAGEWREGRVAARALRRMSPGRFAHWPRREAATEVDPESGEPVEVARLVFDIWEVPTAAESAPGAPPPSPPLPSTDPVVKGARSVLEAWERLEQEIRGRRGGEAGARP